MKTALTYLVIFLATALGLEGVSLFTLVWSDHQRGNSLGQSFTSRWKQHPWNSTIVNYGLYDPIIEQRYKAGSRTGKLEINRYGFIHNGHSSTTLNSFPEKPRDLYRIILLGGSTTAGNALRSDNTQTIAAWTERLLNAKTSPDYQFQVLNFGVSGGYSWTEMNRFFDEVIHLDPDLVISLDGWNDAIYSAFEHERQEINHGIANWSQLSYLYFDQMSGLELNKAQTPPPILTYTFLLLTEQGLLGGVDPEKRRQAYESHPAYQLTQYWIQKHGGLDFLLPTHWEAIATYCQAHNISYLAYLQPFAGYKKSLTAMEEERVSQAHIQTRTTSGPSWERNRYKEIMYNMYARYENHLSRLEQNYTKTSNIRFYNITDIFFTIAEPIYLDMVHYNELGNQLLAHRFQSHIMEILGPSTRINQQG